MRNIRELIVAQIRLFPVNSIPVHALMTPSGRALVVDRFGFQQFPAGMSALMPSFVTSSTIFQEGEYVDAAKNRVDIHAIEVGPRKVVCRVGGSSSQADAVFAEFACIVDQVQPGLEQALGQVIVQAEETTCIARLDLDFDKLFRPAVARFVKRRLGGEASSATIHARAVTHRFAARITYELKDEAMKEHGITLSAKEYVIEPLANTPRAERMFLTKSPFPSDVHLELLQEFEAILM